MKTAALLMALGFVVGCSSSTSSEDPPNPYNGVYDTPPSASPTASEVRGVWNVLTEQQGVAQEQRLKITDDTLTITNRCSTDVQEAVTVGVSVAITIGEGVIDVKDPGGQDSKQAPAKDGKPTFACIARLTGPGALPYALGNEELQLGGVKWKKVAD